MELRFFCFNQKTTKKGFNLCATNRLHRLFHSKVNVLRASLILHLRPWRFLHKIQHSLFLLKRLCVRYSDRGSKAKGIFFGEERSSTSKQSVETNGRCWAEDTRALIFFFFWVEQRKLPARPFPFCCTLRPTPSKKTTKIGTLFSMSQSATNISRASNTASNAPPHNPPSHKKHMGWMTKNPNNNKFAAQPRLTTAHTTCRDG